MKTLFICVCNQGKSSLLFIFIMKSVSRKTIHQFVNHLTEDNVHFSYRHIHFSYDIQKVTVRGDI